MRNGDNIKAQISTCIDKLQETYCQSRAAVTSEVYTSDFNTFSSSSNNGRAAKIINGGKKAVYTFATMAMLNANLTQYARAADITVSAGKTMNGVALDQYYSSATMDVYGTVNQVGIYQSSIQNVYGGGIVNNMIMAGSSPTSQVVHSGGTVNNGIITYSAQQIINSGGTANNITLRAGAEQLLNGGSVYDVKVGSGSIQTIDSGGYASGVILENGYQYISSGIAENVTLRKSETYQTIYSGGIVRNATIDSYARQSLDGGITEGVTVNAEGIQLINSGSALGTIINSGAIAAAYGANAIMTSTTVNSGGSYEISFNASSLDINLMQGGILQTSVRSAYGAKITGINAENGSSFYLSNGEANNFIIYSKGLQTVDLGGIANNTTVSSGGRLNISSGGSALDVDFKSGAALNAYISGSDIKITGINEENGSAFSVSNGVANNLIVYEGGFVAGINGAAINNTIVNSGGTLQVNNATISATSVNSGGRVSINEGAYANNLQIHSGALLNITFSGSNTYISGSNLDTGTNFYLSGGMASNFNIYQGASFGVTANNRLTDTEVQGLLNVYSRGVVSRITLDSGGVLQMTSYGSALDIIQNSGGYIVATVGQFGVGNVITGSNTDTGTTFSQSGNSASGFVLYNGGVQRVSSGGYATNTTIHSGGVMIIDTGSAANVTLHSGGQLNTYVNSTTFLSGHNTDTGTDFSIASGIANNIVLYNGGDMLLYRGTSAFNTIANEQATVALLSSSYASNTIISSGGSVNINPTATALDLIIHQGVKMDTSIGGAYSGKITGYNADTNTSFSVSNGVAIGFTLYEGDTQQLLPGGSSINLVNSGGLLQATGNTVIDNYTATGGVLLMNSGTLTNTEGYLQGDTGIFFGANIDLKWKESPANISFENLSSYDGVFTIDGNMDTLTMDKISVVNNFSGGANIKITNTALTAANPAGNGVKIVEFAPGALINGQFDLTGGKWDEGGYEYFLKQGTVDGIGFDYYLRTNLFYTDVFKTMLNIPLLNSVMARSGMNSLQQRLGDLRDMNNPANRQGIWARTYYKDLRVSDLIDTDMDLFGVEAGYDWLFTPEAPNKLFAGVMIGYMNATSIKTKHEDGQYSKGDGEAPSVGVYATLLNDDKWFVDIAARNFWTKLDMKNYSASGSELKFKPKRNITAVSVEGGKEFTKTLSRNSYLRIEPKAEVTYMRASSNNIDVENGTDRLDYESANYLSTQAGILIGFKKERANGLLIEPLMELAYRYEFNGKGDVSYGGAAYESTLKGGYLETKLGFDMQLTKDLYWYSLAGYEYGSKIRGWGLNAGIRFGFGGGKKAEKEQPLQEFKDNKPVSAPQQQPVIPPAEEKAAMHQELKTVAAVTETESGAKVAFNKPILFTYGSANLTEESDSDIEEITDILKKYPKAKILVQGYTDSSGSAEFNQKLSELRAQSVAKAIEADGIAAERISFKGYGINNPIADNATKEGRAKNRRVELDIQLK